MLFGFIAEVPVPNTHALCVLCPFPEVDRNTIFQSPDFNPPESPALVPTKKTMNKKTLNILSQGNLRKKWGIQMVLWSNIMPVIHSQHP